MVTKIDAKNNMKTKKMTNEGHTAPVPHGSIIGLVFAIGLLVGGAVTFLAVAGRTETVIQQRRELYLAKKLKEGPGAPAEAGAPGEAPSAPANGVSSEAGAPSVPANAAPAATATPH